MKLNWSTVLADLLKLVPYVTAGVEVIHAGESTETKTQLAKQALGVATQAAAQVLSPDNEQIAQVVSGAVDSAITATQNVQAALKGQQPTS